MASRSAPGGCEAVSCLQGAAEGRAGESAIWNRESAKGLYFKNVQRQLRTSYMQEMHNLMPVFDEFGGVFGKNHSLKTNENKR